MIKKGLVVFILLLASKPVAFGQEKKTTAEEYIQTYKDLAISEMKRTGIPASITLAQGLLESGNGNSKLAKDANNHFGIKCKSGWAGKSIKIDDDELQECFRAYDKVEDSYKDHSDFLIGNARYGFLFKLNPTDYKSWAYGLKQAGYATNPKYPDIIIGAIDKYALYQYDSGNTRIPPKALADKTDEPKKNIFGHEVS
jgi:flagellum-specific peptidoglycan hydrolase FlgJ